MPQVPAVVLRPVCALIGSNPFQGRRMSDEWGITRPQGECRKVTRPPIPPLQTYETAKPISWASGRPLRI